MHKTRLEGDHQTLTFGVMQLLDGMQPECAKVNTSWFFLNKWAPYFDSLKPLGLRFSVVCVMWCDLGVWAEGFGGWRGGGL